MPLYQGQLAKMKVELSAPVTYRLPVGEAEVPLNEVLGETIQLTYTGEINCIHCGRASKKSFSQGYCYPCFKKLPQCDLCIMSPERCHFDAGTCRDPEWGEQFCMTDHVVYLANSSGIKVGITRSSQVPTRWIDQGAVQALPILRVKTRYQSGLVEDIIRQHVSDKTNWRKMLKGEVSDIDLYARRDELLELCDVELRALDERFGLQAVQSLDSDVVSIS